VNHLFTTLPGPTIPPEVQQFAVQNAVSGYLGGIIGLARQAFPSSQMCVSLGQDAEDATHQYIALDIEASDQTTEALIAGQRIWSAGISRVCPSRHAVYFVLGWR
jgi:hypothetical protein